MKNLIRLILVTTTFNCLADKKVAYIWNGTFFNKNGKVLFEANIDKRFFQCSMNEEEICLIGISPEKHRDEDNRFLRDRNWNYGYSNFQGNTIIEPNYSHANTFSENRAKVNLKYKYGFIDATGLFKVQPEYDAVFPFKRGLAKVFKNGKYGFIDKTGKVKIPISYENISSFSEDGLALIEHKDYTCSYINTDNEIVIAPIYSRCRLFKNGYASVSKKSERLILNTRGEIVCKSETLNYYTDFSEGLLAYREDKTLNIGFINNHCTEKINTGQGGNVLDFSEGLAAYGIFPKGEANEIWGYIDKHGKWVIPPKYKHASSFENGYAIVEDSNYKDLIINKNGKKLNLKGFDTIEEIAENLFIFRSNSLNGYADFSGKIIIPAKFQSASRFYESKAVVSLEFYSGYTYINKKGKILFPNRFEYAQDFSEGLAGVAVGGEDAFIDKKGKIIFSGGHYGDYFKENRVPFKKNNLWGFLDENGTEVIEAKWEEVEYFSEGLSLVTNHLKQKFFIDKQGKIKIRSNHILVSSFRNGFAIIKQNQTERYGFIDKAGIIRVNPIYENVQDFSENLALAKFHNRYGFIDKNSKIIIEFKFDNAKSFSEGFAITRIGKTCGYINQKGEYDFQLEKSFCEPNLPNPKNFKGFDMMDNFRDFKEGFARVSILNDETNELKFAYIDKSGKMITPYQFTDGNDFHNGIAHVSINESSKKYEQIVRNHLINTLGEIVYTFK